MFLRYLITLLSVCAWTDAQSLVEFSGRRPLEYASVSGNSYVPAKRDGTATLLQLIESRPELSNLSQILPQVAGAFASPLLGRGTKLTCSFIIVVGFTQAFDTDPTWQFTFFAPSNTAFANLGAYYNTFAATPKGKWWLGNQLMHHYVPNTRLNSTAFNQTASRVQSGVYLFIETQKVDGDILLNQVSRVTEADIPVTSVSVPHKSSQ